MMTMPIWFVALLFALGMFCGVVLRRQYCKTYRETGTLPDGPSLMNGPVEKPAISHTEVDPDAVMVFRDGYNKMRALDHSTFWWTGEGTVHERQTRALIVFSMDAIKAARMQEILESAGVLCETPMGPWVP